MFLGINILIMVWVFIKMIFVISDNKDEHVGINIIAGIIAGIIAYGIFTAIQYAITLIIQNF